MIILSKLNFKKASLCDCLGNSQLPSQNGRMWDGQYAICLGSDMFMLHD